MRKVIVYPVRAAADDKASERLMPSYALAYREILAGSVAGKPRLIDLGDDFDVAGDNGQEAA